jgi:hypothetical protein
MTELSPAVLAEDLRALADVVPFDPATRQVLHQAADLLDPDGAEAWEHQP